MSTNLCYSANLCGASEALRNVKILMFEIKCWNEDHSWRLSSKPSPNLCLSDSEGLLTRPPNSPAASREQHELIDGFIKKSVNSTECLRSFALWTAETMTTYVDSLQIETHEVFSGQF